MDSCNNGDPNYFELAHGAFDTFGVFAKLSPTGVALFIVGDTLIDATGKYWDLGE